MKIKYIGHSHHQKTQSTAFFIDILKSIGDLSLVWDESWSRGAEPLDLADCHEYDLVVVFQMTDIARRAAKMGLKNLVFCPMWDESFPMPKTSWDDLSGVKLLQFSSTLHERVQAFGHRNSAYFQYYLDPARYPQVDDFSEIRPFFWQRRPAPSWTEVGRLLGDAPLGGMTLHTSLDPHPHNEGKTAVLPDPGYIARNKVEVTTWFPRREDLNHRLAQANLYFAPREDEGIGMSFLEALAMGMPVVGHDAPTMNEYIVDGVNGFLYSFGDIRPLPLGGGHLAELGKHAKESAARGYRRWMADRGRMLDFLCTPTARLPLARHAATARPPAAAGQTSSPWLSVFIGTDAPLDAGWDHSGIEVLRFSPGAPLPVAAGEWTCMPEPGARPCDPHELRILLAGVPADAEFAVGHQISVAPTGMETIHRADGEETIRQYLRTGRLPQRLRGKAPLPSTPFIRRSALKNAAWKTTVSPRAAASEWMLDRIGSGARARALDAFVLARDESPVSPRKELRRILELLSVHALHVPKGHGEEIFTTLRDGHLQRHLPILAEGHPQLAVHFQAKARQAQTQAALAEAADKLDALIRKYGARAAWLRTRTWKYLLRKRAMERKLRAIGPLREGEHFDMLIREIAQAD